MELTVTSKGEVVINDNVKEYAEYLKNFMSLQVASKMETDEDFKGGSDFIKGLTETQKKIKEAKDNLVNGKAEEVMKILDGLNSEIASKKTEFKKEIDLKKSKVKHDIIVQAQMRYAQQSGNGNYKPKILEECEEAFKGKSSFASMEKDAEKIGSKYINQYKEDEKKIADMTVVYRAVNFKYNKEVRADLIALSVETYFKQGKDADFVRLDLSNKYMREEEEKRAKEEAEKVRLEEKNRKDIIIHQGNVDASQQGDMLDKNEEIKAEIIEEKPQETLDNKESECYNIPEETDPFFKIQYKKVGNFTTVIMYSGASKDELMKSPATSMPNECFKYFKRKFPADVYEDLNNKNEGENYGK